MADSSPPVDDRSADLEAAFDRMESRPPPRSFAGPLSALALLIAFVAVGVGGWNSYRGLAVDERLADVTQQVEALADRTERRTDEADRLSESLLSVKAERDAALRDFEQRMSARLAQLADIETDVSSRYRADEVAYLVTMADRRFKLEANAAEAARLLRAADRILEATELDRGFGLRAAIAEDLLTLAAMEVVDTEGAFLRLSALIKAVPALRERSIRLEPQTADDSTPEDAEADSFAAQIGRFFRLLSRRVLSLVDYRSGEDPIKPLPSELEYHYLRQNLVHRLQQAQLALLQGRSMVLREALADVRTWVQEYFDANDVGTRTALAELEEIEALELSFTVDASLASASKLAQFLEAR